MTGSSRRYGGSRHVRTPAVLRTVLHVVRQLAYGESLRDIEACPAALAGRLCQIEVRGRWP